MSDDDNFQNWQPPKGNSVSNPLEPSDRLWLFDKIFLMFMGTQK